MAEIQTNPSHVHQYGDINLGDVQLFCDATGIRTICDNDAPTHPGGQGSQMVISKMYGWDAVGGNWIRINSVGGGIAVTPLIGVTINTASVAVGVGATVAVPVGPAGKLAITVQNITAMAVLAVRDAAGVAGNGVYLPTYGMFTFDKAIAGLVVQHISGGAAVLKVLYEAA